MQRANPRERKKGEKVMYLSINLIFLLLLPLNTSGLHELFCYWFFLRQGPTTVRKKEVITHFLHTLLILTINPCCGLGLCRVLSHYDWIMKSQITVINNIISNLKSHFFCYMYPFCQLALFYGLSHRTNSWRCHVQSWQCNGEVNSNLMLWFQNNMVKIF